MTRTVTAQWAETASDSEHAAGRPPSGRPGPSGPGLSRPRPTGCGPQVASGPGSYCDAGQQCPNQRAPRAWVIAGRSPNSNRAPGPRQRPRSHVQRHASPRRPQARGHSPALSRRAIEAMPASSRRTPPPLPRRNGGPCRCREARPRQPGSSVHQLAEEAHPASDCEPGRAGPAGPVRDLQGQVSVFTVRVRRPPPPPASPRRTV